MKYITPYFPQFFQTNIYVVKSRQKVINIKFYVHRSKTVNLRREIQNPVALIFLF